MDLKPTLDWVDSQSQRMRGWVSEWANINSYSYNLEGLSDLAGLLRAEWSALGEVEELPLGAEETVDSSGHIVQKPLGRALRIRKRPEAAMRIFLCIHMDTVYPPAGDFQTVAQSDHNTLRGPGVADAKGGLAVMRIAVEALERSQWAERVGWEVLINPDEEVGSPGSSPLFDEAAGRNHVGFLFEPALPDGCLVAERGGSGSYSAVVHGRAAHAGREPHLGRNAIIAASELAVSLARLSNEGVFFNVGRIDGGGPVNVVPDLAICRFNVRVRTPRDRERVESEISDLISQINHKDGIRAQLHGGFHRPPKPLNDSTRALQQCVESCAGELHLPISWRYSGGVSDGNQLAAAGLANIDSLGPRGGSIHSPNEFLLLDSLTERAKLAAMLLIRLAAGELRVRE